MKIILNEQNEREEKKITEIKANGRNVHNSTFQFSDLMRRLAHISFNIQLLAISIACAHGK